MKLSILFTLLCISINAFSAEYILKLRPGSTFSLSSNAAVKILHHNPAADLYKINIDEREVSEFLFTSQINDQIEYLIPNQKIQIEQIPGKTFSATALQKQWHLEKVNTAKAWALAGNKGSKKIVVAVIDTGVDYNHPDLKANMVPGFNFLNNKPDGMDDFGHGTHCAGIIGATGTVAGGVSGISPDVSIMPIKFLNAMGGGDLYTGILAIDYAIEKKVDIISASWGAQISKPELAQALNEATQRADKAGVLLVAAAGNLTRNNDIIPYFPANGDTPSILSVAGTDANDQKMPMSNFGSKNVQIAAPGTDVLSTTFKGKYKVLSGTSMSTPLVAGLAAFLKAQKPSLTAADLRNVLLQTGAPAQVENLCHCRIDAEAATKYVLALP